MNNNSLQAPFLITSREFPEEDAKKLSLVLNRSYVDISNAVNARTISIFPEDRPILTGEKWYLGGNIQYQSFRQVYSFTSTADIPIGFKFNRLSSFSRMSGTYTDGTSWFGLVPATSVAVAGVISFYVGVGTATSDSIKFLTGAGAPALTSGTIVLEWLSRV